MGYDDKVDGYRKGSMVVEPIITNSFVLLFGTMILGRLFGKIEIKGVCLGSSGGLFAGLFISYGLTAFLLMGNPDFDTAKNFIPAEFFQLSLILFIAAVGLAASKNIGEVVRRYGVKFMVLALVVTSSGAMATWSMLQLFYGLNPESVLGTYAGALTSSPGLAAALESSQRLGGSAPLVGLGYSIAYIPGVIIVMVFVQLLIKSYRDRGLLKGPAVEEKASGVDSAPRNQKTATGQEESDGRFNLAGFSMVCFAGVLLGMLTIPLGETLGDFSLGITGGVLLTSLFLGSLKKVGKLRFTFNQRVLGGLRDLALAMFLAIVGLNYGYEALTLLATTGASLLVIGLVTGTLSMGTGYLVGAKVLKIEPLYLIGGLCGGMTSTPGLAAAIEGTQGDEVGVAYGATYPFALFFMIVFINIMFRLV